LNHALLIITILIVKEYIQTKKHTIVKDSDKEKNFVKELIDAIKDIDMSILSNSNYLEKVVLNLTSLVKRTWAKNLKIVNTPRVSGMQIVVGTLRSIG